MTVEMQKANGKQDKKLLRISWLSVFCFSLFPNILFTEISHQTHNWILWVKIIALILLILVSFRVTSLSKLRNFYIVLTGIHLFEFLANKLLLFPRWQQWFGGAQATFTSSMLGEQTIRFTVAILMITALFLIGIKRKEMFLTPGNLSAKINPVKWLGFPKADPWYNFGIQWGIYISLGTFVFLMLGSRMAFNSLAKALPLFPVILLLAAMNAFSEEMTYRAGFLSTLEQPLGKQHANLLAATFFGIAHYYGIPYGIIGVIMATFLGWILGKAMLETQGLFWAWLIHFLQDILIFTFMAVGSIQVGS